MKTRLTLLLSLLLIASGRAQVQVLPPDFTLFGKTSGEYLAELEQVFLTFTTNGDYLLPPAVPSAAGPVDFLQRPFIGVPPPVDIQTYFVPDDVYVYVPIAYFNFDNVGNAVLMTPGELFDQLNSVLDTVTNLHATIDGVALTNLFDYRTESPVFSIFFPTNDNIYTVLLGYPYQWLDDPVVAGGYPLMLKPLAVGLHDFRTGGCIGGVLNLCFERHYQIKVLSRPEWLAHQTEQLSQKAADSGLAPNRQEPLLASLKAAKASFESGNLRAGANQLRAFQQKVRAQVAPEDGALAEQLGPDAQAIMNKAESGSN